MPSPIAKKPTSGGARAKPGQKPVEAEIAVSGSRGIKVVRAVTVLKPAQELYEFFRDAQNLNKVIHHPADITTRGDNETSWVVSAPFGTVQWRSVLINDVPGKLIAWRSLEGADVDNAGTVRFEAAPGDEGTEVTVALEYDPPGGKFGAAVAKFTRDSASSQVYDALRRFKALMETGEIPTIEGQPVGGPQREKKGAK